MPDLGENLKFGAIILKQTNKKTTNMTHGMPPKWIFILSTTNTLYVLKMSGSSTAAR